MEDAAEHLSLHRGRTLQTLEVQNPAARQGGSSAQTTKERSEL